MKQNIDQIITTKKIVISLIHNNDKNRLSQIKPNICELMTNLKKTAEVEFCEISWQPDLKPVNISVGLLRDFIYWKQNRKWIKYKENNNKFLPYDFLILIIREFKKYLLKKSDGKKWLNSCAIELALTNKHINAITSALQNEADYLLVFEDDTVFKDDSIVNMTNLINNLEINNKIPTYIDLAGGCNLNDLKIDKLEIKKDEKYIYYKKPVTNTACCYLINKEQLKLFGHFLTIAPELRYIGADWLINELFILQTNNNIISNCRHTNPTFFNHGSVTGQFKTSIR